MNIAILSAGAAAIVASIATWQVQNWRYGEKIQEARAEQSEAARKAMEAMQREYQDDIARKDKALNEATLRAQKNATLARNLDSDVDRLRQELDTARAEMPAKSCDAVRNYATAIDDVFRESIERYSGLAKTLDECTSNIKLMQDAWPR